MKDQMHADSEASMQDRRSLFVKFAVVLVGWYLLTSLPSRFIATCNGDICDSAARMALTVALPAVAIIAVIAVTMALFKEPLRLALHNLGTGRPDPAALLIALLILIPSIAYFPLLALLTDTTLAVHHNWPWILLSVALYNGVNEELFFRGLIFHRLREGRTFRRAATYAAFYFIAAHLPLLITFGPVVGILGIALSIPTSFPTAYLFERGRNTIWANGLFHTVTNLLPSIVLVSGPLASTATPLYLLVSFIAASAVAVWVCLRRSTGRMAMEGVTQNASASPARAPGP